MSSLIHRQIACHRGTIAIGALLFLIVTLFVNISGQEFAMTRVSIIGDLSDDQRQNVHNRLIDAKGSSQRIDEIKQLLEAADWVHHVEVSRRWPDQLVISIVDETPVAYWNDDAFVSREGKVFISGHQNGGDLAQLYGPVGKERAVMQQYQQLNNALLKSGQQIEVLNLDERGSWLFTDASGVKVLLGKEHITERIQRYLKVLDDGGLESRMDNVLSIDTRYVNGIAVRWKLPEKELDIAKNYKSQREFSL
ncbi:MAG: cell division protein FtsQ [Candidatus Pseudothioglobus sp.]|jgi:cell division protein FtsQ